MNNLVISHLTLRKTLGVLALLLPVVLILSSLLGGEFYVLGSLSAYYWSDATVLFTGMLVAFGIFLIAYKGYDTTDNVITALAGIGMLGTALFPVAGGEQYWLKSLSPSTCNAIHFGCAFIAFSMLGVMSNFQFTKSHGEVTPQKSKRNKLYRTAGMAIFTCIALLVPVQKMEFLDPYRVFFVLETIIVWSFGVSWLTKGNAILKD